MKKYLFPLLLLLPMACTLQFDETTTSDAVTERLKNDASMMALMKRPHKISFDSAALLVTDLLQQPSLKKMATAFALGGTFPVKLFRVSPDSSGIILWFGFQPAHALVFLALEQLKKYDVYHLPKLPTGNTLIRPASVFTSSIGGHQDGMDVQNYLRDEVITTNDSQVIDRASLLGNLASFDSLLSTMTDSTGRKFNQYPFSFFHNNRDGMYDKFLDQAGEDGYVRYYFGFDATQASNKIRVVLMAVDANGKNITQTKWGEEALVLQHSWPPPPPVLE